jgi:hypothetical protein
MPVIYRDQVEGPCLGCDCEGNQCAGCAAKGLGINLPNLVKGALTTVGLRDPLNQYEPGVPLTTVYAKYAAMVAAYRPRVGMLRSDTAKKSLSASLSMIEKSSASLARAFSGGAAGGTRDRDALGGLVQDVRNWRRELWAAEKKYGTNAPPAASEDDLARAGAGGGMAAIGIAALALIGFGIAARK